MSIASRVEITLQCGSEEYFRAGGPDHRTSLPTILKALRRLLEDLVYCADNPKPVLYFDAKWFIRELKSVNKDGIPERVEGGWEFAYMSIPCGEMVWAYPAESLRKLLMPEFLKLLAGWNIDPKAYRFEIRQWSLEVDPDDSTEFDFSDEEAVIDAYLDDVIPEDVMKTCFPHLLVSAEMLETAIG